MPPNQHCCFSTISHNQLYIFRQKIQVFSTQNIYIILLISGIEFYLNSRNTKKQFVMQFPHIPGPFSLKIPLFNTFRKGVSARVFRWSLRSPNCFWGIFYQKYLAATIHAFKPRIRTKTPIKPKLPKKERTIMSNNSSNKLNVPQARQSMDQFKMLTRQCGMCWRWST